MRVKWAQVTDECGDHWEQRDGCGPVGRDLRRCELIRHFRICVRGLI